jgi:hypothetical protein
VTNVEQIRDPVTDIESPSPIGILLKSVGAAIAEFVRQEPNPRPESIIAVLSMALADVVGRIDCGLCRTKIIWHVHDCLVRDTMRPPQANKLCGSHAEPPEAAA